MRSRDSGACCPGLIEAPWRLFCRGARSGIPGLAALASLKHQCKHDIDAVADYAGFRGLLPWPH